MHEEVWWWKNIFWQSDRVINLAMFWQLHLVSNGWKCISDCWQVSRTYCQVSFKRNFLQSVIFMFGKNPKISDTRKFVVFTLKVDRTPEREVRGSKPTAAVLCPWARHFTPRKYWLLTQEAMAPSRYDWKIVDWDVKPQHNQPKSWTRWRFLRVMHPKDAEGIANSVDPDQTAP